MKKIIKVNEGLIGSLIGLIWILYGYISNGYEFDGFPNGIFLFLGGLTVMLSKYPWKKNKD